MPATPTIPHADRHCDSPPRRRVHIVWLGVLLLYSTALEIASTGCASDASRPSDITVTLDTHGDTSSDPVGLDTVSTPDTTSTELDASDTIDDIGALGDGTLASDSSDIGSTDATDVSTADDADTASTVADTSSTGSTADTVYISIAPALQLLLQ